MHIKNKLKEKETMKIEKFFELVKMEGRGRAVKGGDKNIQKISRLFFDRVSEEDKHILKNYEAMSLDDIRETMSSLYKKYSHTFKDIANELNVSEEFVKEHIGTNYTIWMFLSQYGDE